MKWSRVLAALGALSIASTVSASPVYLPACSVTMVETTYFPDRIQFTLSAGDATCPSGRPISYKNASIDNMKAALATVLASKLSGTHLYAVYDSTNVSSGPHGTNGCLITYIGLR